MYQKSFEKLTDVAGGIDDREFRLDQITDFPTGRTTISVTDLDSSGLDLPESAKGAA